MQVKLNPRLLAVAKMVSPGSVVADIGTDHGQLICFLVGRAISPRGYACDANKGPLAAAADTVARFGLEGKVTLHLTDGLKGLPLERIDEVVIAGMGGELIADIIKASPGGARFILQPMSKAERLRRRLYRMGYAITRESAVVCGRFVYTVIRAEYTGEAVEVDELFGWVGLLPTQSSPQNLALLAKTAHRLRKAAGGNPGYDILAEQIEEIIRGVKI